MIAALLVVAAAGTTVAFTRSRFFALTSIEVAGASRVREAEIVDAADLALGSNAMTLDLASAAQRVRELDGVRDARIERGGPLGLVIVVEERQPAIVVERSGRRTVLDREGVALAGVPRDRTLPVVTLPVEPEPKRAPTVVEADVIAGILALWDVLPVARRVGVETFQVAADGSMAFRAGDTRVVFGALDDVAEKLDAWLTVERRVAREGHRIAVIDVRVPARPAVRLA